jgi:dipeptidase D
MDSELLRVMRRLHAEVLGEEPAVKAIHAGLETGILGEKYPGMDMISFGPQIEFPHSPDERVHVASVERFWKLLTATLAELA